MPEKSVHLLIYGTVQGVYYRNWTVARAQRDRLNGWVRNRADGSVEATVCGEANRVTAMVQDCWQGPPAAEVKNIVVEEGWPAPDKTGFFKLPTV